MDPDISSECTKTWWTRKIVEFDESFPPGKPKYNREHSLGKDGWKNDEKWIFAMTERGSLDVIAEQVPSNHSRKVLLPILKKNCKVGAILCSDGWKA